MSKSIFSVLPASRALVRDHGPFRLRRIRPGLGLSPHASDLAFGPLGLVDHARLSPGLVVSMHEHRNDEIVSYLRSGTMWHEDTTGHSLPLDATHLGVMNSGSGLSHEERIPLAGEPVEMLQIFVRPHSTDLPPRFQHVALATACSDDSWRLLVAPEGESAPAAVRNRVWIFDARLVRLREPLATPSRSGADGWLYVFSGTAQIHGADRLAAGDSIRFEASKPLLITATDTVQLVLILVERDAPASRAGTLSG